MPGRYAYILRHNFAAARAGDRLRAAGIVSFFRPQEVARAGLTRAQLPSLASHQVVARVAHGLYHMVDRSANPYLPLDPLPMACARVPGGVVCMLSALNFHGITTVAPPQVWLAIAHSARRPRLRDLDVHIVRFSGAAWNYGVDRTAIAGVPARITSPARTIADCCRRASRLGSQVAVTAFREALKRQIVSYPELVRAQQALPSRRLRVLLETL